MKRIILIVLIVLGTVSCNQKDQKIDAEVYVLKTGNELYEGTTTPFTPFKGAKIETLTNGDLTHSSYVFDGPEGSIVLTVRSTGYMTPFATVSFDNKDENGEKVYRMFQQIGSIKETQSNKDKTRQFRVLLESSWTGGDFITIIVNEPRV